MSRNDSADLPPNDLNSMPPTISAAATPSISAAPLPIYSATIPPNVSAALEPSVSAAPTQIYSATIPPTASAATTSSVSEGPMPIYSATIPPTTAAATTPIVSADIPPNDSATSPPTVSAARQPTVTPIPIESANIPPIVEAAPSPYAVAPNLPTTSAAPLPVVSADVTPTVRLPSGIHRMLPLPAMPRTYRMRNFSDSPGTSTGHFETSSSDTLRCLLSRIGLEQLAPTLEREQITLDILAEMSHEDLHAVGIPEFGLRHRLMRAAKQQQAITDSETKLVELTDEFTAARFYGLSEYATIKKEVLSSVQAHRHPPQRYTHLRILKIQKIVNYRLWERYQHRRREVAAEADSIDERLLFHGSPRISDIVRDGFDERHAFSSGLFGAGIYFAEHCTRSDFFVYKSCCKTHGDAFCKLCERRVLLCRVVLGRALSLIRPMKLSHAPPRHHSVSGGISRGGLCCTEHVVYRGEQAYPEYLISYQVAGVRRSAAE